MSACIDGFAALLVIPAKAGIQKRQGWGGRPIQAAGRLWTPALAGVTKFEGERYD